MNKFNTINASTIIADKFISRSVQPSYQFYNGTFEVALDLSAGVNVLAGNSSYTAVDSYTNRNIYANQKIFFGDETFVNDGNAFPELVSDTSHAYLYGNAANIGVNTLSPKTVFNITGKVEEDTDILTVESGNVYVRNIMTQNKNARGIVFDASDSQSQIEFYNDVSTNNANLADATIKYTVGGVLTTSTENGIKTRSKYTQLDTSGGRLFFDGAEFRVDASVNIAMDTSENITLSADKYFLLDTSGGFMQIDDNRGIISTVGPLVLNSSGGLVEIVSDKMELNALLDFTPPLRGVSGETLYNETLTVYDNSNAQYLPNVYDNVGITAGNAITAIGKDASANTFIRMTSAVNNRGSAIGGGVFPHDTSRSMGVFGVGDSSGNYIPSQTILSGTDRSKYVSTLGINTFAPKTEQYVMDINGALHLGNGEINTIAETTFEVSRLKFSQIDRNVGIATGTPSSSVSDPADYKQILLYTSDGGKIWSESTVYAFSDALKSISINMDTLHVYDASYSVIGGTNSEYIFLSKTGGKDWYKIQMEKENGTSTQIVAEQIHTVQLVKRQNNTHRLFITYTDADGTKLAHVDFANIDASFNVNTTVNIDPIVVDIQGLVPTCSTASSTHLYIAGSPNTNTNNGMIQYSIEDPVNQNNPVANTQNRSYRDIAALSSGTVVAVGYNVIDSITSDQSTVQTTDHANIQLQSVDIYDDKRMVAVSEDGSFMYSDSGPTNWRHVPDETLNTSGLKSNIQGHRLRCIGMSDADTFLLVDTLQDYFDDAANDGNDIAGSSKIQYCFLPNLLNRKENTVFDVSGNIVVSGDIHVRDAGTLYVDATTTLNGDVSLNSRLYVMEDVSLNSRLYVMDDVSLNKDLYVREETILQGDVSMNSRLYVQEYASFNRRLYVNHIDTNPNGLPTAQDQSDIHVSNLNLGHDTKITNIGPVDYQQKENTKIDGTNDFLINIGAVNRGSGGSGSGGTIQIGNYSTNTNAKSNQIKIGGGTDNIVFTSDTFKVVSNKPLSLNNPLLQLNMNSTGNGTSADSGITIRDNSDNQAGHILVSKDMKGYSIKAPTQGSQSVVLETEQLKLSNSSDVNGPLGIRAIKNGLMVLTRYPNQSDASYSITVDQFDISNVLVRDSNNSDDNSQLIRTKLVVEKDVSMNSNVDISGNVNIDGDLMVRKYTEENKYIINTTTTDYTLIVAEDLSLNGRMFVEDDVSLNSKLYVEGQTILQNDVSMNSRLYVQDDVNFNNNFYVDNKTTLNKDTTMNSQLYVHNKSTLNNDVSMNSGLYVQDDVSLNSKLYVHNKSTLNNDVSMNSRLYVQDDVSLNSKLYVHDQAIFQNDVSMNSRLYVQDDVSMKSELYVHGQAIFQNDVSMNSRLYVEGDVLVNRNLAILGDVSFGAYNVESGEELPTNRVDITGSVSIHAVAPPETTLSDVSLSVLDVYRKFGENEFLKKNGLVFKAGYTHHNNENNVDIAESGIRVGEGLLNENGSALTRIPLSVYANGKEYMRLTEEGDLSANNVILHGDVSMNGDLYVQGRMIHGGDVSLNNRLYVQDDVSMNSNLYVEGYVGINKPNPSVALDVSYTDAIRIPRGTTNDRPIDTGDDGATEADHGGYIRYNTETHQFEGFGPGDAWGSLGGVINVAQNTKITASDPKADSSNNELRFYTTDLSHGDPYERMRITKEGDVSMNHNLYVKGYVGINKPNPLVALDVNYTDAIRIPRGTTNDRPIDTGDDGATEADHGGYIRYNTETHQFEGFGPGDAWGSLGGVINVAQNTKITASDPRADSSNNELRFYTTDLSYGDPYERMRITKEGDVSMNHNLYVEGDVSMNRNLYVRGNINLNGITLRGETEQNISIGGASFTGTSWNTAIGTGAGTNNGTGDTNTYVGHNTKQDDTGNFSNSTALGYGATITAADQIVLGIANTTVEIPGSLNITGDATGNSFNAISDMRYKENIETVDNALEKITAIRGVNFTFKDADPEQIHAGVIAQEVERVIPEIVNTKDEDRWTVNYGAFVPYLIESIRTLSDKITTLQDTQTTMLAELDNIKRQNEELNEKIANRE